MPERILRLRILWTQPVPTQQDGRPADFGMQRGRTELLQGVLQPDGSTAYETEVAPYRDSQGRQRFRGECVQGPPHELFLYLSYKLVNESAWIGRAKALLAPLTDEFLAAVPESAMLETIINQLGHRYGMTQWRVIA